MTVGRVLHPSLFDTFSAVPRSESTPPLYYLVAWLWSRPFGTGEVGMRSLSALAGTASIPSSTWRRGRCRCSRRAGLIAAAAVAVSPVLIWFSQDARAYALVFLFTALSFLFFARARRSGERRDLAWWAAFSALALATHYFAGFVVLAEAALLLWGPNRRAVRGGAAADPGDGGAAAADRPRTAPERPCRLDRLPAARPAAGTGGGEARSADDNGEEHGKRADRPDPAGGAAGPRARRAGAAALPGDEGGAQRGRAAAAVGGIALALPLALALLGSDYVDGRNLLPGLRAAARSSSAPGSG